MRVVLLVRPDIFSKFGLHNQNNKLRDNAIILDWETTYPEYRSSILFKMIDNILNAQQVTRLELGKSWDHYFPYKLPYKIYDHTKIAKEGIDDSFIGFLKYSLYRPRDIITMLNILKQDFVSKGKSGVFSKKDVINSTFQRQLADYYLDEILDQFSFYHSRDEFEIFLQFFDFLKGHDTFSYIEFNLAFHNLIEYIYDSGKKMPAFCTDADIFLQLLYELNIICYRQETSDEPWWHWCFRQRTYADLSPKVKKQANYRIHNGMRKAFNVGKELY